MKKTVWTEKDIADLKTENERLREAIEKVLMINDCSGCDEILAEALARQRMSQDEIDAYLESERKKRGKE